MHIRQGRGVSPFSIPSRLLFSDRLLYVDSTYRGSTAVSQWELSSMAARHRRKTTVSRDSQRGRTRCSNAAKGG